MATPNGMGPRPPNQGGNQPSLNDLMKLLPKHMQNQPKEKQLELLQTLLSGKRAEAQAQAARQAAMAGQAYNNLGGNQMVRPNSPAPHVLQPGMQIPQDMGSPAMQQMFRPQMSQQQLATALQAAQIPLQQQQQQQQLRPPLQQQQSQQQQAQAQAARAQYLQLAAQAQLAAAANGQQGSPNPNQTPNLRPAPLQQQMMQRSPSASTNNGTPILQSHPLQNQGMQQMGQQQQQQQQVRPQMQMVRPQGMNMPPNAQMIQAGQMHQAVQAIQGGNIGTPPQMGNNMVQIRPMQVGPGGAVQSAAGRSHMDDLRRIVANPKLRMDLIKIFNNLEHFKEKKQANELTADQQHNLDMVLSLGPGFLMALQQTHQTHPNNAARPPMPNPTPPQNGQQVRPNFNQMDQIYPQLTNQQRILSQQVNGQASVMANRNAMQQAAGNGQGPMQGVQMQQPLQPHAMAQGGPGMGQPAGSSPSQAGGGTTMEEAFAKINELPEGRRRELIAKSGPLRASYFSHIANKLTDEVRSQLFARLPSIEEMYQNWANEQRANSAAQINAARAVQQMQQQQQHLQQQQQTQQQGSPSVGHAPPGQPMQSMNQAINVNAPVPKLQLPAGRQRMGSGSQAVPGSITSPSPVASAVQQAASSPGGSTQGTPHLRPAQVAAMQRSGTPLRVNQMGNRGSPALSHAGSPVLADTEAIAAVQAAAQSSVNDLMTGSQQFAAKQGIHPLQGQMTLPVPPMSAGLGGPPSLSGPQRPASMNSLNTAPNLPGFTPVQIHSMVIQEEPAESVGRRPIPQAFPSRSGQRPTLTSGLGGTSLITATPVLSKRPDSFDRIVKELGGTLGKAGSSARPIKGLLFDGSRSAGPKEDKEAADDDVSMEEPADDSVEEADAGLSELVVPESPVLITSRKRKISEIALGVQKNLTASEGVMNFLLENVDEFIDSMVEAGCRMAKHRKMDRLEVKDVQYHLEREYGMFIPGFESDNLRIELVKGELDLAKNFGGASETQTSSSGPKGSTAPNRASRLAALQQAKASAALAEERAERAAEQAKLAAAEAVVV